MDTPRAAVVHKKNVHIGGGKATVTMKPDKKLKSAKTADQNRKALEDIRRVYLRVVGASKDGNLKQKSTRKGNKVKKNQMTRGKQSKSVLQGFGKGNRPFDPISIDPVWAPFRRIFTDEEIKEYDERAKDGIEGIGEISEEEIFGEITDHPPECRDPNITTKMEIPGSEFEEAFTSEEKVYEKKTDESDFKISDPGRLSSVYTPEELKLGGLDELLRSDYYKNPFLLRYDRSHYRNLI